jgi:hypothetical protein
MVMPSALQAPDQTQFTCGRPWAHPRTCVSAAASRAMNLRREINVTNAPPNDANLDAATIPQPATARQW